MGGEEDYGIGSIDSFTNCTQGCRERDDGVRVIGCLFDGDHVCYKDEVSWEPVFNFMLSFSNSTLPPTCPPDPMKKAKFWIGKKKYGQPKKKTCKWLQKRGKKKIEELCAMNDSFKGAKPANQVCTGTCE